MRAFKKKYIKMNKILIIVIILLVVILIYYFTQKPTEHLVIIRQEDIYNKLKLENNQMAYYFPEECPSYKEGYYIRDNETDKYYVPEKDKIIIVNKNNTWTKEPTFKYLSKVNE